MKHIIIVLGILVAIIGIATVTYTNVDAPKTYSMSVNDMKLVKGGDFQQEDYKCESRVGNCSSPCYGVTYHLCFPTDILPNVCVVFTAPPAPMNEKICDGGVGCTPGYSPYAGCTSYPN